MVRSRSVPVLLALASASLLSRPAAAHAGSLSGTLQSASIPSWLLVLTGGGVIGASFLFVSLLTDHALIRDVVERRLRIPTVGAVRRVAVPAARAAGVVGLVLVVASGAFGPRAARGSFAVLVVWAGWWAGYTISVYLVGNTWPALNPWRTLARLLPSLDRRYPESLGAWPAVAGLLVLIWVEVVSPVAERPRLLAGVIVGYTAVTFAGAAVYGPGAWFRNVDPVAGVFRYYGRMAPVQRTGDGLSLRPPGHALTDAREPEDVDGTAFVIALLWVTTFDGLVTTPLWGRATRAVVGLGVPPLLVYAVALLAGFALFSWIYRVASRYARDTANAYVTPAYIEGWFVPSLLPIAAGYHLAHFLGFFLTLAPALPSVLLTPFSAPATVATAVLPGWFGSLQLAFVVLGHLLAVWVAHALAFEVFTGRLQPIRSQYPYIVAMIFYTMTSMWIIAQPYAQPPYL